LRFYVPLDVLIANVQWKFVSPGLTNCRPVQAVGRANWLRFVNGFRLSVFGYQQKK
jgi:hypothetical protein